MKKPLYKKMSSLALVILFSGAIGLTAGCNTPANQATPTPAGTAQPTAVQPTSAPATEPSTGKASVNWESAIQQIATTDTEATQKADAAEVLAKSYTPSAVELKDFESQIVEEYTAGNYLAHSKDAGYMLTNLFKATVVERNHPDGEAIKKFAFDFYQNTKNVFRGIDAVDSEAVQSNETQMDKALSEITTK
ncbi:hypothetical protein [Paenibacillus silagei]|uniref:Lipoprotein n=1 Tax=Paenibacillus silagei TaxID=1670801 RepID=A0ABS4NR43_9BACL|nr:hypothetical protein [Paenibacillus silagei]MBP2112535.1 hypothetical protein [Paenibacillus silagei]